MVLFSTDPVRFPLDFILKKINSYYVYEENNFVLYY